jgi:hypothetical protein
MEVVGKIKVINAEQQVSASFKKRELVVTPDEQYPQHILIEFTQDKCDLLNALKIGENVTVGINLRGREWVNPQNETKYFNSIQGWKVDKVSGGTAGTPAPRTVKEPEAAFAGGEEEADDLPF